MTKKKVVWLTQIFINLMVLWEKIIKLSHVNVFGPVPGETMTSAFYLDDAN